MLGSCGKWTVAGLLLPFASWLLLRLLLWLLLQPLAGVGHALRWAPLEEPQLARPGKGELDERVALGFRLLWPKLAAAPLWLRPDWA